MYIIKNQIMAAYLMTKGFRLVKLDVDRTNPNRNVYIFNDSEELRKAMSEFKRD